MILNEDQIEAIKAIINKHFNAFLLSTLGVDAITQEDLRELQRLGILGYVFNQNLFRDAFNLGKQRTGAKSNLTPLNYEAWRKIWLDTYVSTIDKQALDNITASSEHYTKKLKDGITNKMLGTVLEANRESSRSSLGSPIGPNPYKRITQEVNVKKLAKELEKQTKDSFRDWERVVTTELNAGYSQGAVHAILEDNIHRDPNDIIVYMEGPLDEGTCKWCKKFYHEGNSFKTYRLTELLANGTNVGRKASEWKAVVPPMHPRCRHRIVELPQGFSLDKNGKMFYVDNDHHELDNPIVKSLQYKVPTFSGWKLQDRYTFQGMKISIERKAGSFRYWKDRNGKSGKTKMHYDYGYIRNTLSGLDGDHVDCYIGPNEDSKYVFIVHQLVPATKKHDEEKVMLGFDTYNQAKEAYLKHYDKPDFFGGMTTMHINTFKRKVLGKETTLIKGMNGHKYVKRTGGPGNYRYWYKLPNGALTSSDKPHHDNHAKVDEEANTHHKDVKEVIANGKKTGNKFYETDSGEKVFIDKDNNEYMIDRQSGEKINIDKYVPTKKIVAKPKMGTEKPKLGIVEPYERLSSGKTVGDYQKELENYGREEEIKGRNLSQIEQHFQETLLKKKKQEDYKVTALNMLDEKERDALDLWTSGTGEGRAMNREINHDMIRAFQRGDVDTASPKQIKQIKDAIKLIEESWEALPPYNGTLFRGLLIESQDMNQFMMKMQPGTEFETEAFTSFTKSKKVASEFGNVHLIVKKNTQGKDVSFVGDYQYEEEVLVKRGTKYRVASIDDSSKMMKKIYLEEVNE